MTCPARRRSSSSALNPTSSISFPPNPPMKRSVFWTTPGSPMFVFQTSARIMLGPTKRRHPDLRVVLAIDPPTTRRRLVDFFGLENLETVVSTNAFVSPTAELGAGSILQHGVYVGRNSRLETCVKVNVGAQIHHDCRVGAFATIAPGARLLGCVEAGPGCYIGAEAVILPKVRLGANVVVGAGAVVTGDAPTAHASKAFRRAFANDPVSRMADRANAARRRARGPQ